MRTEPETAGEAAGKLPLQSQSGTPRTQQSEAAGGRTQAPAQTTLPQQEPTRTAVAGKSETQIFAPAREGGLGRSAAQTWRHLQERGPEGASLEELSEVVGYQQPTVAKHVSGLAGHSLVQQRNGRWYAVGSLH